MIGGDEDADFRRWNVQFEEQHRSHLLFEPDAKNNNSKLNRKDEHPSRGSTKNNDSAKRCNYQEAPTFNTCDNRDSPVCDGNCNILPRDHSYIDSSPGFEQHAVCHHGSIGEHSNRGVSAWNSHLHSTNGRTHRYGAKVSSRTMESPTYGSFSAVSPRNGITHQYEPNGSLPGFYFDNPAVVVIRSNTDNDPRTSTSPVHAKPRSLSANDDVVSRRFLLSKTLHCDQCSRGLMGQTSRLFVQNVSFGDHCRRKTGSTRSEPPVRADVSSNRVQTRNSSGSDRPEECSPEIEPGKDEQTGSTQKEFSLYNLTGYEKCIIFVMCLSNLLVYMSLGILAPFFPQEVTNRGISASFTGWIIGACSLSGFLFSPIIGKILPKLGSLYLYFAGGIMSGGCVMLFGLLSDFDSDKGDVLFLTYAFVLRVISGLATVAQTTATYTWCVKQFPDNVTTIFGIGEVFVGLGLMSGPAVGGVLYGLGGFSLPFLVLGGLMFLNAPLCLCCLLRFRNLERTTTDDLNKTGTTKKVSFWVILTDSLGLLNTAVIITNASTWGMLDATLSPHLGQFNLTAEELGLVFLLMSAFYSVACPLFGWFVDKLSVHKLILVPGFTFATGGMLILGPCPLLGISDSELWTNIIALILLGVSSAACVVSTIDIYLEVTSNLGFEGDVATYSIVTSLFGSVYALGDFIGPVVGGILTAYVDFKWTCTVFAIWNFVIDIFVVIRLLCDSKCSSSGRKYSVSDNAHADEVTSPLLGSAVESLDFTIPHTD